VPGNTGVDLLDFNLQLWPHELTLVLTPRASNFPPLDAFGVGLALVNSKCSVAGNDEIAPLSRRAGDLGQH